MFEDAVDTGSIRSLTKRKMSIIVPLERQISNPEANSPQSVTDDEKIDELADEVEVPKKAAHRISQTSVASLDNVNLDDDSAAMQPPSVPDRAADRKGKFATLWCNMTQGTLRCLLKLTPFPQ
jgi:hypothetical protein